MNNETNNTSNIISKVWNFANVLRDDGVGYGDYLVDFESENFISPADALITYTGLRVDYVLTNPPLGKKSSMTFTNETGEQEREDLVYIVKIFGL
jgi:hypothetical protein